MIPINPEAIGDPNATPVVYLGEEAGRVLGIRQRPAAPRLFSELRASGLLWLINRVTFHPRGFALGLVYPDGDTTREPIGWRLLGDGTEVWHFIRDEDESFEAAQQTLAAHLSTDRPDQPEG